MRYLIENNKYQIKYERSLKCLGITPDVIFAWLKDKKTKIRMRDEEPYNGDLEKCLMKLGKRLQKRWRNRKK